MHISQKPEIQLLDTKAGGEAQHCPAAANFVAAISVVHDAPNRGAGAGGVEFNGDKETEGGARGSWR
jgi:hypothetical protein